MKQLLFVLAGGVLSLTAHGQTGLAEPRHATVLDLTGAVGPTLSYGSAAAWRLWGLDAGGRFQVGLGVRGSYFFAGASDYDGQNTPAGYSLRVPDPQIAALNAAFHVRARVAGPVRVGFNLDVAGFSFGPERTAAASGTLFRIADARPGTQPVRANVLLGGSRDRGSLNSELYVAAALPHGLSVRVGYSHIVTAYETNFFADDAGRYRRFRNLAVLGLSYQLP